MIDHGDSRFVAIFSALPGTASDGVSTWCEHPAIVMRKMNEKICFMIISPFNLDFGIHIKDINIV